MIFLTIFIVHILLIHDIFDGRADDYTSHNKYKIFKTAWMVVKYPC